MNALTLPTLPILECVADLTAPPVVGREYRVRCLLHPAWHFLPSAWLPIIGEAHEDFEIAPHLGRHYHYDARFLSDEELRLHFSIETRTDGEHARGALGSVAVLSAIERWTDGPLQVETRVRRCEREMPLFSRYAHGETGDAARGEPGITLRQVAVVEEMCAGKRIDPARPICPHRGFDLRSLPVDEEGCVTCPGHGARWCMTTGELRPRVRVTHRGTNRGTKA